MHVTLVLHREPVGSAREIKVMLIWLDAKVDETAPPKAAEGVARSSVRRFSRTLPRRTLRSLGPRHSLDVTNCAADLPWNYMDVVYDASPQICMRPDPGFACV